MLSGISKSKISTQLILFFSASIFLMLMIILATYYQSLQIIKQNNSDYTTQSMYQISQELNGKYDTYERMILSISFNQITQDYIYSDNHLNGFDNINRLYNFLKGQMGLDDALIDICIVPQYESVLDVIGIKEFLRKEIGALNIKYQTAFSYLGKVELSPGNPDTNTILIGSNIYPGANRQNYAKPIGIVVLVLDADKISKNINNMSKLEGTEFFLTDKYGIIYSSNNDKRLGQKIEDISETTITQNGDSISKIDGVDYYIYHEPTRFDGMIINIVPVSQLLNSINRIRMMDLILVLISILVLSIPLSRILKNIVNPLKEFSKFMKTVKQGNLTVLQRKITLEGHEEVSAMADNFNGMLAELDSLTNRLLEANTQLYQLEITKRQLELEFLQSQINPHFLYNTLESIKGIALYKKVPEIQEIAQALADIFRYSIKGEDMVALREEIEILKSYIQIQHFRFSDRLEVVYEISEDTLDCIVPKMILQPIAENAIYHGLELCEDQGRLLIKSEIVEGQILEITIQDNGIGLDDEAQVKIGLSLEEAVVQSGVNKDKQIGVGNVNNRIQLQYGVQYGLAINGEKGTGTKVVYRMPVTREESCTGF